MDEKLRAFIDEARAKRLESTAAIDAENDARYHEEWALRDNAWKVVLSIIKNQLPDVVAEYAQAPTEEDTWLLGRPIVSAPSRSSDFLILNIDQLAPIRIKFDYREREGWMIREFITPTATQHETDDPYYSFRITDSHPDLESALIDAEDEAIRFEQLKNDQQTEIDYANRRSEKQEKDYEDYKQFKISMENLRSYLIEQINPFKNSLSVLEAALIYIALTLPGLGRDQ